MKIFSFFIKLYLVIKFIIFIVYDLIIASLKVAYDVLTPHYYGRPGIIEILMDCKSDLEITAFGNILSLTPGTLTLDVSEDKKYIYVHVMYLYNVEHMKQSLKKMYEQPILEILE